MGLGSRIKEFRELQNISVSQLADHLSVTANNIYQIERGEHAPSTQLFIKILNFLKVTPEELLQDESTSCAVFVFEKSYFNAMHFLPTTKAERCRRIIDAAIEHW